MSKHMFHYLVKKSKALPASVVITISWPYLRAKVFISSGCDTDGLRENISEEMTDGGMSWESQQSKYATAHEVMDPSSSVCPLFIHL